MWIIIESNQNSPGLEEEFSLLNLAVRSYKEIYATIGKYSSGKLELVGFYSTRVLHSTAMLYCGRLIAEQAVIALRKLAETKAGGADYTYYRKGFISQVLHQERGACNQQFGRDH